MSKLNELLALKDDASEQDICAAVTALKADRDGLKDKEADASGKLSKVATALGVAADAPAEKFEAAVLVLKGGTEAITALTAEVAELRGKVAGGEADALILAAKNEGKLLESQTEWARTLILKDRDAFDNWRKSAPVVRPPGRTAPPPEEAGEEKDRDKLILKARSEYAGASKAQREAFSERGLVNARLMDAGLAVLSDDEAKTLKVE